MKQLIALILILGVGAGAYFLWSKNRDQADLANGASEIRTTAAEIRDIKFAVNAAGEIGPAEQVSVRPEINGRIETLPVDLGDQVRKGQILFTLDDQELKNERDSSQTDIDRAQLQLAQTERNYNRAQQLYADKLISEEEFENFRTERDLAKNALTRSQNQLAILEERLTKTQILAPFDCTVLARPVSVGQAVSGSGGVGGGTEVLAIADLKEMIIQAHINQADVTRLKVKQDVEVRVEAVSGLSVTGLVERIAPQATIKNNIKGFLTRILLREVDPRIRPGMTANIKIPVATVEDVVTVPLSAVFTEYNQNTRNTERHVFIKRPDGKFERRPIKLGLSDFFHAEIQEGLAKDENVCLEQPPLDQVVDAPPPDSVNPPGSELKKENGSSTQTQSPSSNRAARSNGSPFLGWAT